MFNRFRAEKKSTPVMENKEENVKVHDFHSNEYINSAQSMTDAFLNVIAKDIESNPNRVYRMCGGFCQRAQDNRPIKENELWSGDSWGLQQYMRENPHKVSLEKREEINQLNANRLFGRPVTLTKTDELDTYIVEFRKPSNSS